MNLLDDVIKQRRSIRAFKSKPVSRDGLVKVVKAGVWAPDEDPDPPAGEFKTKCHFGEFEG